ncbi:MAG: Ig-like domain-containing protein [Bacteroidetes bacterium]|nr:Ig-like domain-containing protein [Bacteroidota bacterium]
MAKQVVKIVLAVLFILLLERCAQIGSLTGGTRDTTPPKLLEAIPANKTINFNSDQVILKFDEHVKLADLPNQLIISPKLGFDPDIQAEGKKIIISFNKQTLLPNTTYRFYFGKAIIDMTEANPIENFEYVFSTGNTIDSLKIKGIVLNGFNNKPEKDIIIGLYNKVEYVDSLPYKKTPNYITRTSESGEFAFGNLPHATYKVYALADKNKNYLYDGDIERIAFNDSELDLSSDTSITLNLFKEEAPKAFIKKTNSPYYGFSQVILNKKSVLDLKTLNKEDAGNIFETNVGKEKDTLSFYYKNLKDTLVIMVKNLSYKKTDTIKVQLPKVNSGNKAGNKKMVTFSSNAATGKLAINTPLQLSFLNWMDTSKTNMSKLKLTSKKDSLISEQALKYKWININTLEIGNKLKQGLDYSLKVDSNAFFDVNRNKNDSSLINFQTQSETELGKLSLKLLFNKKQGYLVQVINDQEQIIREQFIAFSLSGSNAATIDFTNVAPGTYKIKIVFDVNENKKWDTGDLNSKIQPEHVFIHPKPIKILADWEIEEEILIKE